MRAILREAFRGTGLLGYNSGTLDNSVVLEFH